MRQIFGEFFEKFRRKMQLFRHTIYPGVRVMRAYVFRPINTKQEAQAAALNATPSLEGGICSVVSALLVRVESPARHGFPG
jgi:hypothetical protein